MSPASNDNFAELLATARAISDPDDRDDELGEIARAQARAGLFQEALETTHEVSNSDSLWFVLAEISEGQAEAGLWRNAVETAHAIDSPYWTASSLLTVVEKQAAAGLVDDALDTARTIEGGVDRAVAFVEIGRAQADGGSDPGPLIGEVMEFARAYAAASVEEPQVLEGELRRVATALTQCGFVAEALELVRSFQVMYFRASMLAEIFECQPDDELFEEGMAAARHVPNPTDRQVAYHTLAAAASNEEGVTRAFSGARDAVHTIREPAQRVWGENRLALAQADAGQRLAALDTANSIDHAPMRQKTFQELEKRGIDREEAAPGSFKIFALDDPTFRVIYVPEGPLGDLELMQKGGRPGLMDIFSRYAQEGTELEVTPGGPKIRAGWDPKGAYVAVMQAFRDFGLNPTAIGSVPDLHHR